MTSRLRNKYVPTHHQTHLLLHWLDLKQGRRKVRDYITEFEECRMRCRTVESPEQQIVYFVRGLKPELGAKVLELNPMTVDQAYRIVEDNEYILEKAATMTISSAARTTTTTASAARTSSTSTGWPRNPTPALRGADTAPPAPATTTPTPTTSASTMASTARAPPRAPANMKCFKCQGFGHRASECVSLFYVDVMGNQIDSPAQDSEVDVYQGDCPDDEDEDSQALTGIIVISPASPPPSAAAPHLPLVNIRFDQTFRHRLHPPLRTLARRRMYRPRRTFRDYPTSHRFLRLHSQVPQRHVPWHLPYRLHLLYRRMSRHRPLPSLCSVPQFSTFTEDWRPFLQAHRG